MLTGPPLPHLSVVQTGLPHTLYGECLVLCRHPYPYWIGDLGTTSPLRGAARSRARRGGTARRGAQGGRAAHRGCLGGPGKGQEGAGPDIPKRSSPMGPHQRYPQRYAFGTKQAQGSPRAVLGVSAIPLLVSLPVVLIAGLCCRSLDSCVFIANYI